jgi:hypothetical protein
MHPTERRSRPNRNMATVVNAGLNLHVTHGREAAELFMADASVPEHVIDRVLSQPDQRRAADPH